MPKIICFANMRPVEFYGEAGSLLMYKLLKGKDIFTVDKNLYKHKIIHLTKDQFNFLRGVESKGKHVDIDELRKLFDLHQASQVTGFIDRIKERGYTDFHYNYRGMYGDVISTWTIDSHPEELENKKKEQTLLLEERKKMVIFEKEIRDKKITDAVVKITVRHKPLVDILSMDDEVRKKMTDDLVNEGSKIIAEVPTIAVTVSPLKYEPKQDIIEDLFKKDPTLDGNATIFVHKITKNRKSVLEESKLTDNQGTKVDDEESITVIPSVGPFGDIVPSYMYTGKKECSFTIKAKPVQSLGVYDLLVELEDHSRWLLGLCLPSDPILKLIDLITKKQVEMKAKIIKLEKVVCR